MRGKRVLVIDDDGYSRRLMKAFLELLTAVPLLTSATKEGFETALKERPDAIFVSTEMPDIPVKEFLQMIEEHPDTTGIPVTLLTPIEDDVEPHFEGRTILPKDLTPFDFFNRLQTCLPRR